MDQVMVFAYYPTIIAIGGYYNIYIKYFNKKDGETLHKIGTINYDNLCGKVREWIVDKNTKFWNSDTKEHQSSFELYIKYSYDGVTDSPYPFAERILNDWRFVVYFKTRMENFDGITEDPNLYDEVNYEFCHNSTGYSRIMGAFCPYDMNRKKYMDSCLNFQRNDIIGEMCTTLLAKKEDSFVSKPHYGEIVDCNWGDCH